MLVLLAKCETKLYLQLLPRTLMQRLTQTPTCVTHHHMTSMWCDEALHANDATQNCANICQQYNDISTQHTTQWMTLVHNIRHKQQQYTKWSNAYDMNDRPTVYHFLFWPKRRLPRLKRKMCMTSWPQTSWNNHINPHDILVLCDVDWRDEALPKNDATNGVNQSNVKRYNANQMAWNDTRHTTQIAGHASHTSTSHTFICVHMRCGLTWRNFTRMCCEMTQHILHQINAHHIQGLYVMWTDVMRLTWTRSDTRHKSHKCSPSTNENLSYLSQNNNILHDRHWTQKTQNAGPPPVKWRNASDATRTTVIVQFLDY